MLRFLCALLLAFAAAAEVRIAIRTDAGVIEAAIDDVRAPATASNFLKYVDADLYNGGRFHRTVRTKPDNQPQSAIKIDVIQASPKNTRAFAPIPLERTSVTGLKHADGAISMARSDPDSATGDFFICIGAQPSLDFGGKRNPDGQGFAAFGRVTRGMDVVRKIQQSAATGQQLTPPVKILSISRQ